MDSFIFGFFALAYVLLLIWGLRTHKKWTFSSVIFFVVGALIYDNAIYALGILIGEGTLLEALSLLRFWFHMLFTPTLIIFSAVAIREAGIEWAQKAWVLWFSVIGAIAAMIIEYVTVLNGLALEVSEEYGALSYSSAEEASGPPLMILLVLIALVIAGIMLWWKAKWPWMFVGTVIMTIGSAVPLDIGSNALTNAFELILLFTLVWTKKQLDQGKLQAK